MKVIDNFLPLNIFEDLVQYVNESQFIDVNVGNKTFNVLKPPEIITDKIYNLFNDYKPHFSFIRKATKNNDSSLNIHADGIINNEKTHLASVLYISESQTFNGTAFWKHHIHGKELPIDISESEFDRLLTEDANDLSKWKKIGFVQNVPNRLLTYNANCFHSKYPSKIEDGERIVLVTFYKKI